MSDRGSVTGPGRRRRPTTPDDVEDKLAALHEQLAEQVRALRSGEDWRRWLTAAARFHRYSFGNILLIQSQREATAVASRCDWIKRILPKEYRWNRAAAVSQRRQSSPERRARTCSASCSCSAASLSSTSSGVVGRRRRPGPVTEPRSLTTGAGAAAR